MKTLSKWEKYKQHKNVTDDPRRTVNMSETCLNKLFTFYSRSDILYHSYRKGLLMLRPSNVKYSIDLYLDLRRKKNMNERMDSEYT